MIDYSAVSFQTKVRQTKLLPDKLHLLLVYAVLAPSNHNSQPWLFRISGNTIELYADRTRLLPVSDPLGRELTISCGAALFYLTTAIHYFGHNSETELLPDKDNRDLLARIHIGKDQPPSDEHVTLFNAMTFRHTNRGPFEPRPLPYAVVSTIKSAATKEGTWLHVLAGNAKRRKVTDLILQAGRLQASNKQFRRELAEHIHFSTSASRDGIPLYALGMSRWLSPTAPWIIHHLDWGHARSLRDHRLLINAPLLTVLSTRKDNPVDWLKAGQALARLLLTAASKSVSASFFNAPIELPTMRESVRQVFGRRDCPQMLLRLGYGGDVRPTPRRPIEEVLID